MTAGPNADPGTGTPSRTARVDLHCHTRASFDSLADPAAVVARALARGLTHIAITDHDVIGGALEAVAAAPPGIHVLVGCETHVVEGDLVFVFLERAIPSDLPAREAIIAAREQGALVGVPHPFDPTRRSLLLDRANLPLLELVDWVEGFNGRVERQVDNEHAVEIARRRRLPAIAVSDAHALLEIGRVYTTMTGDPSTASGLLEALRQPMLMTGQDAEPVRTDADRPSRAAAHVHHRARRPGTSAG